MACLEGCVQLERDFILVFLFAVVESGGEGACGGRLGEVGGGVVVETDGAIGGAGGEQGTGWVPGDVPGAFDVPCSKFVVVVVGEDEINWRLSN